MKRVNLPIATEIMFKELKKLFQRRKNTRNIDHRRDDKSNRDKSNRDENYRDERHIVERDNELAEQMTFTLGRFSNVIAISKNDASSRGPSQESSELYELWQTNKDSKRAYICFLDSDIDVNRGQRIIDLGYQKLSELSFSMARYRINGEGPI